MSRLIESTLTGKISRLLLESENEPEVVENAEEKLTESAKLEESRPGYNNAEKIADFLMSYDPYEFRNSYEGEDDYAKKGKLIVDIEKDGGKAAKSYIEEIINSGEASNEQIEEAKEILKLFEEDITPEDLEREDQKDIKHNKKAIEDKIAELRLAIQDGVSDDEKASMEKEIGELEDHLNESGYGRKHVLEEGWSGTIKSGAELRKRINDAGEEPTVEDCRAVLDALKACCEEAKTLTDDEYYQNGFQSVIDDIEMIYDDEDLELSNVDWELDGFYDWCDSANLWCELSESNVNEAYKADDGQYPPYRFSDEDAEYFRNLLGPGFKVDIRNSSAGDAPNGTMDISLDNKWVTGWMSSSKELDAEIDKYFAEKNPELEVHRNNTGMTLWLGEKSAKKESTINESAEGVTEFWNKFDNGEIKIGDTFGNLKLLDANKEKDYILVDRGYEFVAAWAPELDGDKLVWGQGHYFDKLEDAKAYFNEKLNESVTVVTSDGSSVDTSNAASVQSNDGNVTVITNDATVTINNNPTEPAVDLPQEEPAEEVPAEEIVPEEPVEDTPVEEPVEDEVIEEADDSSDVSIVSGSTISTVKNQGNVYMISIKDTEGNEKYWVCENYDASTNEADEATEYDNKADADKDYFERVGLEPVEA